MSDVVNKAASVALLPVGATTAVLDMGKSVIEPPKVPDIPAMTPQPASVNPPDEEKKLKKRLLAGLSSRTQTQYTDQATLGNPDITRKTLLGS